MKVITELNEQVEVSSPNEFVDVFRNIYARGSDKYSLRFSKQGLCALYDYFKETGVDPDVYNITQLYKEYDNVLDAARFFCFKVQGHEDPHAVEDADNFRAIWAWMNKHACDLLYLCEMGVAKGVKCTFADRNNGTSGHWKFSIKKNIKRKRNKMDTIILLT